MKNLMSSNIENNVAKLRIECFLLGLTVVFSGIFLTTSVSAQSILEEVVVTAQKREQSIQDVGISITAFSGDQIKALGMNVTTDISQQVPGLQLNSWTPSFTIFNLRGVSQSNFLDNLEAPIAVYINDSYVASMNAIGQQMYDMERVEVLRGPQGTLFGRNATGGLIHYLTRGADEEEVNGYLEATAGEYDRYSIEGAIGGAITDNLRGRIAGIWDTNDGYFKAQLPNVRDSNGSNVAAVRATLDWDVTDNTTASLIASYSKDDDVPTGQYTGAPATADPITGFGVPTDLNGNITSQTIPFSGDVHEHFSTENTFFDREAVTLTGKIAHELDNGMELVSITNYMDMDKYYLEDGGAGLFFFPFITEASFTQWSEELRLSGESDRMRWQAGGYYLNINSNNGFTVGGIAITGSPMGLITNRTNLDSENWSLFGQLEYDFTDQFTAIAGLRWSQDDKEVRFENTSFDMEDQGIPSGSVLFNYAQAIAGTPFEGDDVIDYGDVMARVQLNFTPSDDTLLFASWNRGIKGGNWTANPDVVATGIGNIQHQEEVLNSFEIGVKTEFSTFNSRLNATAFYYDYKDYQVYSLTALVPQTQNSDAEAMGGEIELYMNPTAGLDFIFGASFIDSEIDEVRDVFGGLVTGNEFPNAPSFSFNWLGRYAWPAFDGEMAVQLDGKYNDDQYLESTNAAVMLEEAYSVWNASMSYTTSDEKWKASLFVKNMFDEEYRLFNLDLGALDIFIGPGAGFLEQAYAPPRWIGGTVSYRF